MDWVPMNDLSRAVTLHHDDLVRRLTDVLDSGWFLLGPQTRGFANELAAFLDVPHVATVGNGTDALQIALTALMPDRRSVVLTAANAGGYASVAARSAGFTVEYADVDPETHCLDPRDVSARLTEAVGVVVVTHLYGRAADMTPILQAAHAVGALVLEDCAQALGAIAPNGRVGSLGDAATFSFYPTKNLGALGDGGAIATRSDDLAASVRRLQQYGWDTKYRIASGGGRNSRMDEIQAAVLRVRLPLLDEWNEARRSVIRTYVAAAPDGVRVLSAADPAHTGHLAVVEVEDRGALAAHMAAASIRTDIHYPIEDHRQPAFADDSQSVSLPVTEALSRRVLSLPVFPEMRSDEIERVGDALASF